MSYSYTFDGKYGPIPYSDNTVDLSYYFEYIKKYNTIKELPLENKEYLHEVFTNPKYKVINMDSMFYDCSYIASLDTSDWDTSHVTNMRNLFCSCEFIKNIDVSNWDTGKVVKMTYMFSDCYSLENIDVYNWNTSNVVNMDCIFNNCFYLDSVDISKWNMEKVKTMYSMFKNCINLKSIIGTIDINFSNKIEIYNMLLGTESLPSVNIKLPESITKELFIEYSKVSDKTVINFTD